MDHSGPIDDIATLQRLSNQEHALQDLAAESPEASHDFIATAEESPGFLFLAIRGATAVRAFKLLEVAQTAIGNRRHTADLNIPEWKLLQRMLGGDLLDAAANAYQDCKKRTARLEDLTDLDERMTWRLSELIHLFENVMLYGQRTGRLKKEQANRVLGLLLRDFGEYYGLLADDVEGSARERVGVLAQYLTSFRQTPMFRAELPVNEMTRLPLSEAPVQRLLDFEIARGIAAHPLAVKERVIRGDADGQLASTDPVEFNAHQLRVIYARDLDEESVAIVNAILPVLAVSAFEGLPSLSAAEAYITKRQEVIRLQEQQCFAMLECLAHFDGVVSPTMKAFRASDVMKAAKRVYKEREREQTRKTASTALGMLRETMSGAFKAVTTAVDFDWPKDSTMYRIAGYPESMVFFPQQVTIRNEQGGQEYIFLCHADTQVDPNAETPLMFEYQAFIGDTLLFDPHAACRNLFAEAPVAFKMTLASGPAVVYAKRVVHPGEREAAVDMEEVKLLATFVALSGGMQSWLGQHYALSDEGANIFLTYPDVQQYVARLSVG